MENQAGGYPVVHEAEPVKRPTCPVSRTPEKPTCGPGQVQQIRFRLGDAVVTPWP